MTYLDWKCNHVDASAFAARYLWGRKLRTFLTTLAIVLGTLAIFCMSLLLPTMLKAFEVNMLAALYPARRAAGMEIVRTLRYG